VVAFPRMASNVLNDVTGSTNPPATLQSIRGISYILNHITHALTIRIKWPRCGRARPNDRHHSHSKSNRADTIIYMTFAYPQSNGYRARRVGLTDISIWRAHRRWCNAEDFLDSEA
jgi:hypothetical protein